jgi:hypothetical protein
MAGKNKVWCGVFYAPKQKGHLSSLDRDDSYYKEMLEFKGAG